jgi:hypothetical protein
MKVLQFVFISIVICLLDEFEARSLVESDSLFEGDIIPDFETISAAYDNITVSKLIDKGLIVEDDRSQVTRGTSPTFDLWTTNMNKQDLYIIFVYINPEYNSDEFTLVRKSLNQLARKSGVMRFKVLKKMPTDGRPFLHYGVHGGSQCASYIGRKDRLARSTDGQPIFLHRFCLSTGVIQHETMHALGFWHEQSRPDRDEHVTIIYDNIVQGKEINFEKQNAYIDSLGAPYDYNSVMHYHSRAFSINGEDTIDSYGNAIGQRYGISPGDNLQLRLMYQCSPLVGPRNYTAFKTQKCTPDCKCGRNWKGCRDDSNLCKGKLQCQDNTCVKL